MPCGPAMPRFAIQAALRRYSDEVRRTHGLTVDFRVGLNSGEVVVRAIDNDLHMDYSAIGQTVHLAARMEQLATPGNILLTPATLRLVEGLVQVNALGPIPVKGLTAPVEVSRAGRRQRQPRRRLQAGAGARSDTLCGTGERSSRRWRQALGRAGEGHGHVVAHSGRGRGRQSPPALTSSSTPHRHPGLAGPGECVGVLRQGHALCPRSWTCSSAIAHIEDHDDMRTLRAKVTGQVLTLDGHVAGYDPSGCCGSWTLCRSDSSFVWLDPSQRAPAHPRRAQAGAPARKPGAAPAAGVRRFALDRHGDASRARSAGRQPANGPPAAARELPPRVPARLGFEDLLYPAPGSTRCHPRALSVLLGGSACWPSARATCPEYSLRSNGPWACVRTQTSRGGCQE